MKNLNGILVLALALLGCLCVRPVWGDEPPAEQGSYQFLVTGITPDKKCTPGVGPSGSPHTVLVFGDTKELNGMGAGICNLHCEGAGGDCPAFSAQPTEATAGACGAQDPRNCRTGNKRWAILRYPLDSGMTTLTKSCTYSPTTDTCTITWEETCYYDSDAPELVWSPWKPDCLQGGQ